MSCDGLVSLYPATDDSCGCSSLDSNVSMSFFFVVVETVGAGVSSDCDVVQR